MFSLVNTDALRQVVPFLLFLFLAIPGYSQQNRQLSGKVIDTDTQEGLEYASVAVYSPSDSSLVAGGVTDSMGSFSLEVNPGTYFVRLRFIGYKERVLNGVQVGQAGASLGTLSLDLGEESLGEVVVAADKLAVRHQIDRQVYGTSDFQAAVGGTATDLLRNLPAMSVNAEGEISFRGTSGFVILIDGKPIQADAAGLLNQLPANAIEDIEVITSPSARFDPEGKAGIINIVTKKGATDGTYLLVNVLGGAPSLDLHGNERSPQRYGGDFTLSMKKNKWDISVGADYNRNDVAGYRDGQVETYLDNTVTSFPSVGERSYRKENYSGRALVGYTINPQHAINASAYGGTRVETRYADISYSQTRTRVGEETPFDALNYFNMNERERRSQFFVGSLDYTAVFANKSSLSVSGLYEYTNLTGPTRNLNLNPLNYADTLDYLAMDELNPLNGTRINVDYTLPLSASSALSTGYQYRHLRHVGEFAFRQKILGTGEFEEMPEFGSDIDLFRTIHAVYGEYQYRSEDLSVTAGLRVEDTDRRLDDYGQQQSYDLQLLNLFPSLSINYDTEKGITWKGSYSRRIERTTTSMMNPFLSRRHSEVLEVGDPELLPELVDAVEVGLVKNFERHSVFANAYYRRVRDAINRVNTVYNDSILLRVYTNAGVSQVYGAEAGADLEPTDNWKVYVGGTLYYFDLQGAAVGQQVRRNSWNYSFNVNSSWNLGKDWNLVFNLNYLSRIITVQGEDSRFFSPNTTLKKSLLGKRLDLALQWRNMGMGVLDSNRQRISGSGEGFFTSTHYIYERDVILLTASYRINQLSKKLNFTKSEFGDREF
ncbi:TonB-dependent receptor domain protein [Lunatimonas lonarensis]|uniref:TonB-dependent receptor domain protein n=1 Tax=Lunatimonas lonarensis TaxID=1232681 RepID=R7ZTJ4_9BACT|nr:TonB-dependent receptor [Lunatimonas lonarensis]EON77358.1 TonB-dependent receptor domain protein [Lunatimonas lonarensis]